MPPKRNYKKRSYRKKRSVVGSRKRSVSVGVKKYVKKQIHKNIENKKVQIQSGLSFGSVAEAPDFNPYPMLPQAGFWSIPGGVGQGGRIGNQCTIRKLTLSYVLFPKPYDVTTNPNPIPQEVDLYLGYVKSTPSTTPSNLDIAQLYQAGSGVAAPSGTLRDLCATVNTDYWTIKKRWRHKIGYSTNSGTGGNAGNAFYANNDFKYNVVNKIDITKFVPKQLLFNDSNNTVMHRNLFFMHQSLRADNNTTGATQLPMGMEFWIDIEYEDA